MTDPSEKQKEYREAAETMRQLAALLDIPPEDMDGPDREQVSAHVARLLDDAATMHATLEEKDKRHEQDEDHMGELRQLLVDSKAELKTMTAMWEGVRWHLEQSRAEVATLREALKELQQRQHKQDRVFRVGLAALEFIAGQLSQEDLEQVVLREHAERQGIQ